MYDNILALLQFPNTSYVLNHTISHTHIALLNSDALFSIGERGSTREREMVERKKKTNMRTDGNTRMLPTIRQ